MAVPKRRMSRANTRSRRAQWKATKTDLVGVSVAGQQVLLPVDFIAEDGDYLRGPNRNHRMAQ